MSLTHFLLIMYIYPVHEESNTGKEHTRSLSYYLYFLSFTLYGQHYDRYITEIVVVVVVVCIICIVVTDNNTE